MVIKIMNAKYAEKDYLLRKLSNGTTPHTLAKKITSAKSVDRALSGKVTSRGIVFYTPVKKRKCMVDK